MYIYVLYVTLALVAKTNNIVLSFRTCYELSVTSRASALINL